MFDRAGLAHTLGLLDLLTLLLHALEAILQDHVLTLQLLDPILQCFHCTSNGLAIPGVDGGVDECVSAAILGR